jgi:signal transduction histidine kinase
VKEEEQGLQAILGSIQESVVASGPDQRVTFMNRAAEGLLGCSFDWARGRRREEVLAFSTAVDGISLLVRPDRSLAVELTETPLLDPQGQAAGTVAVLRDATQRLRAQAERERAAVQRAAHLAVEQENRRATLLADVSLKLAQSFEHSPHKRLRAVAERLVPELADWCLIDGLADGDQSDQTQPAPFVRLAIGHPAGATPDVLDRLSPVAPAAGPLLLGWVPEVGDDGRDPYRRLLRALGGHSLIHQPLIARGRTLAAMTLVRSRGRRPFSPEDLEHVGQLAERCAMSLDNGRLYREAQEAIRLRDDFMSIASHELKTPLTPLQLQIQNLERRTPDLVRDEDCGAWLEKRLATIRRQGERLNRLVTELLEISRIMGGRLQLELERVDLSEVMGEVVAGFAGRTDLPRSELRVTVPPGIVGRWDRLRLEQVVSSLLSNALKYGRGEPITIDARLQDDQVLVTVEDHGIGIAPEDQERVFGRFERAVSTRHYGGLGLGLFITRQVVEAMGGEIRVRSEPQKGSAFTVSLPLASHEQSHRGTA